MARITFKTEAGNGVGARLIVWAGQELVGLGLRLIERGCRVRWELRGGMRGEFRPTIVANFYAEGQMRQPEFEQDVR